MATRVKATQVSKPVKPAVVTKPGRQTKQKPRGRGRPPGPSSTVVNIRLPDDLIERLARYIDNELRFSLDDVNRATIIRPLVEAFLTEKGY